MSKHDLKSITRRGDAIKGIARYYLNLECLEERYNDNDDFREHSVLLLVDALEAAYEAGRSDVARSVRDSLGHFVSNQPLTPPR
mgnify:FL=1